MTRALGEFFIMFFGSRTVLVILSTYFIGLSILTAILESWKYKREGNNQ